MTLSVVINTKDAASTLERTLKSVEFADEIVVVDMHSSDDTIKIAKKFTDKIFTHKDTGYVEPARNHAISKATGDWILVLDADEEVSQGLKRLIIKTLKDETGQLPTADAYYIPRKNLIFDKWIEETGWWPDFVLRLFKKGFVEWTEVIHSVPITKGVVKELDDDPKIAIIHHNYQSITQFIERMNRFSDIQSRASSTSSTSQTDQKDSGTSIDSTFLIEKFHSELLRRLFEKRGIDEGMHGMSLSLLQSLSEAIVVMKSWESQGFKKTTTKNAKLLNSMRSFQRDLNYWLADWQLSHSQGLKKIYWRVRRKLQI